MRLLRTIVLQYGEYAFRTEWSVPQGISVPRDLRKALVPLQCSNCMALTSNLRRAGMVTFIATLSLGRTHSPEDLTPNHGLDTLVLAAADASVDEAKGRQRQNEALR